MRQCSSTVDSYTAHASAAQHVLALPVRHRYCKFDIGGTQYTGLCDPNGRCYDVYKYQNAVTKMQVKQGR